LEFLTAAVATVTVSSQRSHQTGSGYRYNNGGRLIRMVVCLSIVSHRPELRNHIYTVYTYKYTAYKNIYSIYVAIWMFIYIQTRVQTKTCQWKGYLISMLFALTWIRVCVCVCVCVCLRVCVCVCVTRARPSEYSRLDWKLIKPAAAAHRSAARADLSLMCARRR